MTISSRKKRISSLFIAIIILFASFANLSILHKNAYADSNVVTAPTNLRPFASSATVIYLTWDASISSAGPVTSYDVYKGTTLVGTSTLDTTFKVSGLIANTSYTFYVKAKDSAGNVSVSSDSITLLTGDDPFEPNNSTPVHLNWCMRQVIKHLYPVLQMSIAFRSLLQVK